MLDITFWLGLVAKAYNIQCFKDVQKDTQKHIAKGARVNTTSQLYVIVTQIQNLSWKGGKVQ